MKIEHPKGPRCLTFMASGQRIESVDLDVYQFPHECSVPNCPGNVNRLKLEMFDAMLSALERSETLLSAMVLFIDSNDVDDYEVFYDDAECDGRCLANDSAVARDEVSHCIAKAKELK